jgi:hypothetical protein
VAARGRLFLLRPVRPGAGRLSRYPAAGKEYAANRKLEPYIAIAGPGQRSAAGGCSFTRDTVYAIESAGKTSVIAVAPGGRVRRLAEIRGVKTLNGIAFDNVRHFGRRLLVVGLTAGGQGALISVDCRGKTRILTLVEPHLEGGLAVAPAAFGAFAGDLLAPLGQPAGGDIGVENVGFVPPPMRTRISPIGTRRAMRTPGTTRSCG